ncbi:hypothetical protein KR044_000294 [Drosophila immigrans]|nr:hypothetical protein KR044_000294 [Drosophila immigrans]
MANNPKNVDLKLQDVDVLTTGILAELVNGILDFLLFHRSQIPFVYKTYKYYVEKWDEIDETQAESFQNYQLQQQRFLAKTTKESISNMREAIRMAFQSSKAVKSLRFLFGNNTFMPSESYTIHIPHADIARNHGDIHVMPEGPMNQTLLRLLTCEELYALWSTELKATNVYLELELLTDEEEVESYCETLKLYPKEVLSQLPRSCKNVHLHLSHVNENDSDLTCCKQVVIFQDFDTLNIDAKEEAKEEQVCCRQSEHVSGWWQSDIIVRGFRAPKYDLWSS